MTALTTVDKDKRLAYFDSAEEYTPYLATAAGAGMFLVKTEDKHIGRSLFGKQARGELMVLNRATVAIRGLLGDDAVFEGAFIDVGANIGTTTVPAILTERYKTAVAIEPEPENVRVLRLNILLNDLEERIAALPVAVSDTVGQSELVVTQGRGGKHWIATNDDKRKAKRSGRTNKTITVDTVTLDQLVETGQIDPDHTGLVWIDAEAHEGHILAGASTLLAHGTPLVLEWNPANLDKLGDREGLQNAVAEHYTHFAGMHRNPNPNEPSFPLHSVDRLPAYADRFLDRKSAGNKTDILVLRLTPEQSADARSLDDFLRGAAAIPDEPDEPDEPVRRPSAFRRLFGRGDA
jgi:FkbM family methyltransferase